MKTVIRSVFDIEFAKGKIDDGNIFGMAIESVRGVFSPVVNF